MTLAACLTACAPDYPNDDTHDDTTNADCIDCHVNRVFVDENPREVPSSHTDGGNVKSRYKDCKGCHDKAE